MNENPYPQGSGQSVPEGNQAYATPSVQPSSQAQYQATAPFPNQNPSFEQQAPYTSKRCTNCGAEIDPSVAFCPVCGKNQGEVTSPKKTSKVGIIIAIIAAVLVVTVGILTVAYFIGKGDAPITKDFKEMFGKFEGKSWCELASDGSYLEIDTNPEDYDDDSTAFAIWYLSNNDEMDAAIAEINKTLGFAESLQKKMNTTNSSQGKQTDENDQYKVTWSYHPDRGLKVIYEMK